MAGAACNALLRVVALNMPWLELNSDLSVVRGVASRGALQLGTKRIKKKRSEGNEGVDSRAVQAVS